ncbi:endonuclease/exonuclease/phosphatase family protein [Parapedobacter tibetensis]|uniref:endonuclease/exonuclease/phosphatase family protein n=1 Tax=Parapedobacter tibetensis TaxID=2972951 RepID=UPI00214DEC5E|nr:endonuclease/exonuclease/phosphatase family protein [Parapedobacter tibetensis]
MIPLRATITFFFTTMIGTCSIYAQGNFKVLSYNVLKGLQQDTVIHKEYVDWVKEIDPDLIAYQEMNGFTQESIEEFASKYGHPYAVTSKVDGFPVALSSKHPIVKVEKVVANMWHAYLYANINDVHVFVVHFSPFSYVKRQFEMKEIMARAALIPSHEKIIIMGDFNSLSSKDSITYNQNLQAWLEQLKTREVQHDHIRNLNDNKLDYSVMEIAEDMGYHDLMHQHTGIFKHSIPTERYATPTSVRNRIDYILANSALADQLKSIDIIHDEATHHMSDHYPVLAIFDLQ